MCQPNSIHPEAERERFKISSLPTSTFLTQMVMSTETWVDAVTACNAQDMTGLRQSTMLHSNGKLFIAERKVKPLINPKILVQTVAAVYYEGSSTCWDVFACDVTGSGWVNGPDSPEERAFIRVP